MVTLSVLLNCSSSIYVITSTDEYDNLSKSNSLRYCKYIVLNTTDSNSIVVKTAKLLKKNKYTDACKYLSTIKDTISDDYLLSKAMLCIFNKSFIEATNVIEDISENYNNKCLKYLLYADCLSEGIKGKSIQEIVGEYQKALDCNYNDVNKEIINIRIKLVKYNY
jgi:hypothetical protein